MAHATSGEAEKMAIGELARLTSTSPRLLQYYEAQGLLRPSRTDRGHRRFASDTPRTVRSIRMLLDAGVPTRLIRDLLDCVQDDSRLEPCAVPTLAAHLDEHDRRLSQLSGMRSALQDLIDSSTTPVL